MECNKEEAIRAKIIAESRMQAQDFEGAQKIALKAQRLFPDLENISQILTVCEVHCAAEMKIGRDTDWYAVLQVEMTADESTIKKQYRKLALLLHPDKNKLAGADAAFHLVGDAYKILSDPSKRSQHDMIKRAKFSRVSANPSAQKSYWPSAKKQPGPGVSRAAAKSRFAYSSGLNQYQPSSFLGPGAFWTMCPFCSLRQQFYQNLLNQSVYCQKCSEIFVSYDLKVKDVDGTETSVNVGETASFNCQKSDCVNTFTMEFQRPISNYSVFNQGSKPEPSHEFCNESKSSTRNGKVEDYSTKSNDMKFQNVKLQPICNREQQAETLTSQKRCSNEDNETLEPGAENTPNSLRRSSRHKRNVSSFGSLPPSKKPKHGEKLADRVQNNNAFPGAVTDGERERNGHRRTYSEFSPSVASMYKTFIDPENLIYHDPEFCDFESERCKDKFSVHQIWALYDSIDGMPRFYARVKKVYCREFKLQLNWLESDPRSIAEMKWSANGLPISCGSFKLGKSFNTQERHIFSHLVPLRKGMKKNTFVIYPRRGEIWALFKNWDIRWSSQPDLHRAYEYQIVEVVSDFTEAAGIKVICLVYIKEFMALFVRVTNAEENLLQIRAKDVLMFSHMIPARRITGKEADGVPEGAFELDCASLPTNFKTTLPSISLESIKIRNPNVIVSCNDACINSVTCENKIPKPTMDDEHEHNSKNVMEKLKSETGGYASKTMTEASETLPFNSNGSQCAPTVSYKVLETANMTLRNEPRTETDNTDSQNPDSENQSVPPSLLAFEYPESEFYDFESDRLMEKFECGQVWAFYCEIDNFPKYYGRIRLVDREKNQVHVRWLEFYSELDADDYSAEGKPPRACGSFRAVKETCTMDSGEAFSHRVKAELLAKDQYYIFPKVGEVWAVFRNWSPNWSVSDLKISEFDVVEISACEAPVIKFLVLIKVDGYVSVFSRPNEGHDAVVKSIPFHECSGFSHRIPAYQLTKELGSDCFWELDPAAVPTVFLTSIS